MDRSLSRSQALVLGSLGLIGAPLAMYGYGVPMLVMTVLWIAIAIVVFWLVLRPLFFPEVSAGSGW